MHTAALHVAPPSVDTSTDDTATLSEAVPVIVYGSADDALSVLPSRGSVIVDDGIPESAVV